jgi:hypothetical protein
VDCRGRELAAVDTLALAMFDLADGVLQAAEGELVKSIAADALVSVSLGMLERYDSCSLLHTKVLRLVRCCLTSDSLVAAVGSHDQLTMEDRLVRCLLACHRAAGGRRRAHLGVVNKIATELLDADEATSARFTESRRR